MNIIGIKDLIRIHGKSKSFFDVILCRPEFGQYRIDNDGNYFKFNNEVNLHRQVQEIIRNKVECVGMTCRGTY